MSTEAIRAGLRAPLQPPRPRIRAKASKEVTRDYANLVAFGAITALAAAYGSRFNPARDMDARLWYASRRKSPLTPPPAVFGPVWAALYGMIAIAGWRVHREPRSRARTRALSLWATQMALNAAWSPIFFGARRPRVALADLLATMAATTGFTITARDVDPKAPRLMLPYLAWMVFAGYLNTEIVRRNPDTRASRR